MIVETRDLRVKFGRSEALKGIDLRIPEGAVFAMLGPNGAGKSTTIRVLMNVLRPDAGEATVLGTDSRRLGPRHFQRIGFVSESQRLPGALSLRSYFDYLSRLYERWDRSLARRLCAQFDLPPDRQLKALSHGMRIKAVLVGALAYRPSLLVLDEPLSGLDTVTRDEIVGGLLQQVEETTVLISSHELSEIETFTTHVAFLQDGQLAIQESIESLQTRFREVTATLSDRKTLPTPLPDSWLMPEVAGHRLRFVHAQCSDEADAQRELIRHFGAVRATFDPMSLRAIAGALIQDGRRRRSGSPVEGAI
jgi:ABC-2 type transport system ATP-binding protein